MPAPRGCAASGRGDPVDVVDRVDATHRVEHAVQVHGVAHLEHEAAERQPVVRRRHARREDVHVVLAEHARDVAEQPRAVERLDLDLHQEHALGRRRPLDLDEAIRVGHERLHVRAVGAVHRDPAAARDEADDLVARHGGAALGELDEDVGRPAHQDAGVAAARLARRAPPAGGRWARSRCRSG